VPEVIVPHCDSPQHPASSALGQLADHLERARVPVIRLSDGQALIVDGTRTFVA
jgi:hypothetical protein